MLEKFLGSKDKKIQTLLKTEKRKTKLNYLSLLFTVVCIVERERTTEQNKEEEEEKVDIFNSKTSF